MSHVGLDQILTQGAGRNGRFEAKQGFGFYPDPSLPRSGRGGRRFKSCHSDQLSSHEKSSWGTIWGTKRSPREHLLCLFKHAANSLKPGHAAYAGDVRFIPESGHLLSASGCPLCANNEHWQRLYARSNNCFAISATLGSRGRGFKDSPFPRISIIIVNTATRPYGLSFAGTKYQGARFSEVFSNISSIATS